ncbi:response regulator transcription factor (plasmid) [Rhizobium sp. WL3]|jgi:FixJ family two-component response regulator|uniref:response regulator transcription factor n=1 Tax=Rhizobium sp. WL3 TaxID=2603277 RepID=UPI0011C2067F|nr:response regulator [Rhizobium sp. WL3]QEE43716.1 response regulator transcription factor [Rhizobium sp. WL3]
MGINRVITEKTVQAPLIHIIDDDRGLRAAITDLLQSAGYQVASYESPSEFLQAEFDDRPACLILDIRMPEVSGLDFQDQLKSEGCGMPIILMSGFGDVPTSVRGIRGGAVDFIEKPIRAQDLLDAIARALEEGRRRATIEQREKDARQRFDSLTPRERDVIERVLKGELSKQIAFSLSLSEVTVKVHRAAAMKKLKVRTLIELTRLAQTLGR